MCGIAGAVRITGDAIVDRDAVKAINSLLTHRGPDGDGFHFEEGVALGHRRLSIIDLEGGKQPLFNEDHSVVVTYNGEIYNFRSLMEELKRLGHTFRTRCDTEVIVHAWEQWGPRCVDRFNGMFAFAVWDRNRQTCFLARDRLGIKPLYYTLLPSGELVFASELKSVVAYPSVSREIDPLAVEEYFAFGYVPDPRTIYSGIQKLEPGHTLELRRGETQASPKRYWDVPLNEGSVPYDEHDHGHLVKELKDAVERRLIAEVPLGAFLSGGIDSSAVVAMMREVHKGNLLTCSIGFKEPRFDESRYAQMVADAKQTDHRLEIVEPGDDDTVGRLVGLYDEPFADSSAIPTYRVCGLARKHVTVALSGDGGDENFIGYRRYSMFSAEEVVRSRIPFSVRQSVFGTLGRVYPKLDWAPRFLRGKTTFEALARSTSEAYRHAVSVCADDVRARLFSASMKRNLQGYSAGEVFARHLAGKEFEDHLRMVQYLDFKTYLPGDILTKVDRASMAHSLEVRVPLLDYTLVESVARMPTCVKLRGREGKYVLKKAMEPYLPREVLYRKKMGFGVPLDAWFRQSLKEQIHQALHGERLRDCGMFESSALECLWKEHQSGHRDHGSVLWSLLMFDGFLRGQD